MSGSGKILVVDDEDAIREIVAFDLQDLGCDILHANSGKAAFACVKAERPDVVVSDMRMPGGSGTDLLRWVKALDPVTPAFVFMTAFSDISADEALDLGAEACLPKPLEKQDIVAEVRKAMIQRPERWARPVEPELATHLRVDADGWRTGGRPPRVVLGSGGMFVEMDQDLPKSLELVSFALPADPAATLILKGIGRVRWVRPEVGVGLPAGVGIEFLFLSDQSRQGFVKQFEKAWPQAYVPLGRATSSGTTG